jgi:hypothetical protein
MSPLRISITFLLGSRWWPYSAPDRHRRRGERGVYLKAAGGHAPQPHQRNALVGFQRVELGHQPRHALQIADRRIGGPREQVVRVALVLQVACVEAGVGSAAVVAVRLEGGQGKVIGDRLHAGLDLRQPHLQRQRIALRRTHHLAVRENRRQLVHAQHVRLERLVVDLQLAHAPGVGMQGARRLVEARLVVAVLLLEVLRPQEQPLAPQHLGWDAHVVSLAFDVLEISSLKETARRLLTVDRRERRRVP